MLQKIIHFIEYNNLTVLLILALFLLGGGVFAATPTGQDLIGTQQQTLQGVDNTLLLQADLDKFDMNFKIEKIEEDANYYYVTYTYLDLVPENNAWQYQIEEKVRKVSKKLREDIGVYMAGQLRNEYEQRIRDLRAEQESEATETGSSTRTEVVEYTGLIGQTLDLVSKTFPGYEPVKKYEVPSPTIPPTILQLATEENADQNVADDLSKIYQDYIASHNLSNDLPSVDTSIATTSATSTMNITSATTTVEATNTVPVDQNDNSSPASTDNNIATDTDSSSSVNTDSSPSSDAANSSGDSSEPTSVQIIDLPAQ